MADIVTMVVTVEPMVTKATAPEAEAYRDRKASVCLTAQVSKRVREGRDSKGIDLSNF